MAIPKLGGGKKLEFTPMTWGQLAGGAVCIIVALILGWVSFGRWRFKAAVISAYEAFDQGNIAPAKVDLETAIGWNREHAGAHELLAKIECEGGRLDKALAEYNRLLELNHGSPTVKIGMGVLALKAADRAESPKAAADHVKTAQAWFAKAGGVPEGSVGLGHCELVLARKLGDPKRYDAARAHFLKVASAKEFSLAGAVDYYAGLGAALGAADAYDPASSAALRSWYQYAPRSHLPFAALLRVEAERFRRLPPDANAMVALKSQGAALGREMREKWKGGRDSFLLLLDPWIVYSMEFARAMARAGDLKGYEEVYKDVLGSVPFDRQTDPMLFDAGVRLDLALKETEDTSVQEKAVAFAVSGLGELLRDPRRFSAADDATKDQRARVHNAMGWVEAWRGGYEQTTAMGKRSHESALNRLREALKGSPDDYVYNRNAVVLMKRLKLPAKDSQAFLDKAKAAASKEFADDFAKVQQFLAGE